MADAKPGPLIQMVKQRHSSDCAIACLAMFIGVRYEDVLVAVGKPVIDVGMTVKEIRDTAERLKHPLRLRRKFDLDGDTGILGVRFPDKREHVVILHDGHVYDTDYTIWDVEDYLAVEKAKPVSLLVRK